MKTLNSREVLHKSEMIHEYDDGIYKIKLIMDNGLLLVDLNVLGILFGKTSSEFLDLPSTISLITNLGKENITQSPVIAEQRNSDDSFTWVHTRLALEYAYWLCPGFKVALENYIKRYLMGLLADGQSSMTRAKAESYYQKCTVGHDIERTITSETTYPFSRVQKFKIKFAHF